MTINPDNLAQFKLAYGEAVQAKLPEFSFLGHEVDTQYAGYLIRFLTASTTEVQHG